MSLSNFPGFQPAVTSVLRTVDEPKMKKKFNWDRVFYVLILLGVAFLLGRSLFRKFGKIEADGQVLMEKISVSFTDDIRIKKLRVNEGDEVKEGDTLFTYVVERPPDEQNNTLMGFNEYEDGANWFLKERLSLSRQINLKESERAGLHTLIQLKKTELESMRKRVYLGAEVSHKLAPLEDEIQELQNKVSEKNSEMAVLRQHSKVLAEQEKVASQQEELRLQMELDAKAQRVNLVQSYTSPIAGLIGQIQNQANEVTYEGEDVMTIHQLAGIEVKAYFDPKYAGDISVGDEVSVHFEDGSANDGIIKNFYVSTYPLPPEFQKRYEPVTRSIVAVVSPVNDFEGKNWLRYYKMSVKVTKYRFRW